MPNTKEFLYTYFAVQRIGALVVPINARLVQQEILYILNHSDAVAFFTHELLFEQVKSMTDLDKLANLIFVKTGERVGEWLKMSLFLVGSIFIRKKLKIFC